VVTGYFLSDPLKVKGFEVTEITKVLSKGSPSMSILGSSPIPAVLPKPEWAKIKILLII
jgi:hypothetical protein